MNVRHVAFIGLAAMMPAILAAPAAIAHHSFAAYDLTKVTHVVGTVKKFDWINPHSFLAVVAMNEQGKDEVWNIELGTPGVLARQGWNPKSLVPGDKVDLTLHPNKDGSTGGQLTNLTGPNGLHTGGGEGRSGRADDGRGGEVAPF